MFINTTFASSYEAEALREELRFHIKTFLKRMIILQPLKGTNILLK
ncbi:hypothetical protein QNI22_34440 [Cytophagaceae bacterium BD1B2-1]|uniref:Uncharacterized protein n=1 Tax=Xanthocytophaga agilis TaxID=3048010 RepID=A0AAE3RD99_9BACT|nr:hypothetical protein [Xanthocytophaga agilis]